MATIDSKALVSPKADLGANVDVGPFSIIEENVVIGDGCQIGAHVRIASGTRLGAGCRVFQGAVLGSEPQDLKFVDEEPTFLEVGEKTTIREYATLNRATTHSYYTRVGSNCLLMAYSHVAHDCQIGDNVVLANSVNLAGHVIIESNVGIGGLTAVHQFVKIGRHAFIGGMQKVKKDIPPYILAMGEPTRFAGLNRIGLQRRGFSAESLEALSQAYRVLYRQNHTVKRAIEILESGDNNLPEVTDLINFLKSAERGIIR